MRLRWFRIRETTAGLAPGGSWMCRVRSGPDCCLQVCGRSSGEPIVDNLAGRRFGVIGEVAEDLAADDLVLMLMM